ncbi:GntR family transcriptional regulator [Halanaerobium saccharolyticum]|uniref:GntR family transcriptional regulator n=1 Tax=Halanaerobium saccharolyticum TaxID=43595 RepID=A0A4R7YX97_9FIRM|nr:GntR family transcriptional regulator [Halanaerobium saccharolyticum]RAK08962.1 GntR family transcriptional regulator [Halanaerobium saccharolyticum]TDW02644.1 GntR family transcriptional regulator [Halanaerobium saccharolyticum]TDX60725.1 GntR family transcriptional regulator [Halanaerobium saccharolyticum]
MQEINKNSPLPLYYQLKESILTAVQNREFEVGERLPSERELAEYNNISRMTVKKAVDILVDNGYLIRKQGSGTFVNDYQQSYSISPLLSFTKEMEKKGLNYTTRILNFAEIKDKKAAVKMNLNPEAPLFRLERLRLIENKPFLLENTYLAVDHFRDLKKDELENNSLFKIIKDKYNIQLSKAEAEVEAVILNGGIAEKMQVKEGLLGLYFEQISKNENAETIEYTSAYYRNDNYKFKFTFDLD